jgi:hypothetical protein
MAVQSRLGIFLRCPYADDLARSKPSSQGNRVADVLDRQRGKKCGRHHAFVLPPPRRKKFKEVDGEGNSVELNFLKEIQ